MNDRRRVVPMTLLLAAAGAVHLAAIGPHLDGSRRLAVGFLLFGLLQLALAVALVVRPSAGTAKAAVAVQLVAIAVWALSRTVGLPVVGGGVEPVAMADTLTVLLEAATLLAWGLARRDGSPIVATGTLLIVAVVTVGLAGAAAASLGGEEHGEHAHVGEHDVHGAAVTSDVPAPVV